MKPMQLDVLVALFAYGGNGGVATLLPEIAMWLAHNSHEMKADPRIGRIGVRRFGDIPLTMERNKVVKYAKDNGFDAILMIDSDNAPDLYLGQREWAEPFWKTSFDFLYERKLRGVPTVVCAPYCGPSPHPVHGGAENVYVFHAEDHETGDPNSAFRFQAYSRHHAAKMRGIQEIAAGPTGCILYSTDAFDLMPVHQHTQLEVLEQYQRGTLSAERTLRLLNMQSWFFYEFTDQYQTQKASTEDVTNTREIQMAGLAKHRESVVFCNWNAWAGHYKPKCVGMPEPISINEISGHYIEAIEHGAHRGDEIREIDFTDDGLSEVLPANEPEVPVAEVPADLPLTGRLVCGRVVKSLGFATQEADLNALRDLVASVAAANPEKLLRVIEVGSWVGESAIAIQAGFGQAGGHVYCVEHFQGSASDMTGEMATAFGKDAVRECFMQNTLGLLGSRIRLIEADEAKTADSFPPQEADLVYLDAGHSYQETLDAIARWVKHVDKHTGILAGHDYGAQFPGVALAVRDFCRDYLPGGYQLVCETIPGTAIWFVRLFQPEPQVAAEVAGDEQFATT